MLTTAFHRARIAVLGCAVAFALLAGGGALQCAPAHASEQANAESDRVASSPRCTGGAGTPSPAVGYSTLTGDTFAKREAAAGGRVLRLRAGSLALRNFKAHSATLDGAVVGVGASGLVGAGIGRTTVRLAPHSSTRKKDVPTAFPRTNQLSVLRLVGPVSVLRGFTLRGTSQGHLYNGLRVERTTGLLADHVRVIGVPGNDYEPPGETFAINDYATTASSWSHIRIDGDGVGASGLGVNSSKSIRICDAVSRRNSAMGFAFWQSRGIVCTDCRAVDNGFSGFNFERTSGTVVLTRPSARGNRYDMRIASDRSSARFRIVDPELQHGTWTVWMPKRWYGAANVQRRSDVTLILHGRTRNDLLRFRTY